MGVTFDERLTTAGFVKGSSVIPFLGESEFDSRWRSANPHFLFITSVPNRTLNIWTYELGYWLLYNIGTNHVNWEWWWDGKDICWKFEFKEEEDKVKFILRWL